MRDNEFNKVITNRLNDCLVVLTAKGEEYATEDRLHNFRTAAELQGITMVQALAGMMAKHTVSVYDLCMSEDTIPRYIWAEKITDHINYLLLLEAILTEEDGKTDA